MEEIKNMEPVEKNSFKIIKKVFLKMFLMAGITFNFYTLFFVNGLFWKVIDYQNFFNKFGYYTNGQIYIIYSYLFFLMLVILLFISIKNLFKNNLYRDIVLPIISVWTILIFHIIFNSMGIGSSDSSRNFAYILSVIIVPFIIISIYQTKKPFKLRHLFSLFGMIIIPLLTVLVFQVSRHDNPSRSVPCIDQNLETPRCD